MGGYHWPRAASSAARVGEDDARLDDDWSLRGLPRSSRGAGGEDDLAARRGAPGERRLRPDDSTRSAPASTAATAASLSGKQTAGVWPPGTWAASVAKLARRSGSVVAGDRRARAARRPAMRHPVRSGAHATLRRGRGLHMAAHERESLACADEPGRRSSAWVERLSTPPRSGRAAGCFELGRRHRLGGIAARSRGPRRRGARSRCGVR